jgi:UDP-N-acetyl-D-mannosaminuronic acid transferase (WecB/TagA/CpsF family)
MTMEPRRLAKRYLRNNPAFLALLAAEKLRGSLVVRK